MKKNLADALARKGYDILTPVQQAVTQPELQGRDLLVSAQTGSGKTIGFGLAIAPTVLGEADSFDAAGAPLALIIAPTRELALQVKRELGWLYGDTGAMFASCVGGMDMRDERRALARGAHVVVATPGRLRDHIMRGSIDLTQVRAVVLDEADEMLDLGFREDLEFILEQTAEDRQTLLFSATVPSAIVKLAQRYQRDAERVSTVSEASQHADIDYRAMLVAAHDSENAIINALRFYEAPNAIVFCNTRAMVGRLTARLSNRGFSVVALSGELTQAERSNALQAMRDGRARVCVATDVAARGIDLPNLDLVVHAELPSSHETLLHRSGRTGRAGRKGVSALVVAPSSRKKAERILKFAKLSAEWGAAPSADDVNEKDQARMLTSDEWQAEITESEAVMVSQLLERFTPEQIAAAYLRQHKARHSAPEELSTVNTDAPKPRAKFGPSVWFSISEGRNQNASPRHLLPMVCKAGDVTKDDIGGIRIGEDLSYVEIRKTSVEAFLKAIGPDMKIEGNKEIKRIDGAPDVPAFKRPKFDRAPKGKPHRGKQDNAPVDWNDAPAPRHRKPKPDAQGAKKPWDKKPKAKEMDPEVHAPAKKRSAAADASPVNTSAKPRKDKPSHGKPAYSKSADPKPTDAKPSKPAYGKPGERKPAGSKGKPAGGKGATGAKGKPGGGAGALTTPKGKPNSKKNRARAAAAKLNKGGDAVLKRR